MCDMLASYHKGIYAGIGIFCSGSIMMYFYWPSLQKNGIITASNVLSDNKIKNQAILLTTDVIKSEHTKYFVKEFIDSIYNDPDIKRKSLDFCKDLIKELKDDDEIKEYLVGLLTCVSLKTLQNADTHKHIAQTFKNSAWKLFF